MKSILLSSAAIVGFAGAAAADGHSPISFGGDASLEYNSNGGFSYGVGLSVTASEELDNGLTVAATFGLGLGGFYCYDGNSSIAPLGTSGYTVCFTGYELSLTSDSAGLYFGDTGTSADTHWVGVGGMEADGFNGAGDAGEAAVLRGEASSGSVTGSISYGIDFGGDGLGNTLAAMQFAAVADLGSTTVVLAYQANDAAGADEIIGLSGQFAAAGADLTAAFAQNSTTGEDSLGLGVSYPVGPVTVGVNYATNAIAGDAWDVSADYANGPIAVGVTFDSGDVWTLEGSYDVGNGLVVSAGLTDSGDDYYLAADYDLGNDASFYVQFAEDGDGVEAGGDNEFGPNGLGVGTTVGVSFAF